MVSGAIVSSACFASASVIVFMFIMLGRRAGVGGVDSRAGAKSAPPVQSVLQKYGTEGQRALRIAAMYGMDFGSMRAMHGRDGKVYTVSRKVSDAEAAKHLRTLTMLNARLTKIYNWMKPFDSYRPFLEPFVKSKVSHVNMDPNSSPDTAAATDTVYWTWIWMSLPCDPDTDEANVHFFLHEMAHVISKNRDHNIPFFYAFKNITSRAIEAGAFDPKKLNPKLFSNMAAGACGTGNAVVRSDQEWEEILNKIRQMGVRFGCSADY